MKHTATKDSRKAGAKALAVADRSAELFAGEFEALESRILLSGFSAINKTSFTFTDSDGDKVTVKAVGKGATFDLVGFGTATSGNIDTISVNGGADAGIQVVVTPVKLAAGLSGVSNGVSSNGITSVNEINGLASGYGKGSTGLTTGVANGGIYLSGVVAYDLNFKGQGVSSIAINPGRAYQADLTNNSVVGGLVSLTAADQVAVYDVSAAVLQQLNVDGLKDTTPVAVNNLYTGGDLNNIVGTVEVGDLGQISARNSAVSGNIIVNRIVGDGIKVDYSSAMTDGLFLIRTGDATLDVNGDFAGQYVVATGHLNARIDGDLSGTLAAATGISGLDTTSTTDTLFLHQFTGMIHSAGGVSNLEIGIGTGSNGTINNESALLGVGNITALSGDLAVIVKSDSAIGNLSSPWGNVTGTFESDSTIGTITAYENITGSTFRAVGNIGNAVAGNDITGTFYSVSGSLGSLTAEHILAPTVSVSGNIADQTAAVIGGSWTSRAGNIGNLSAIGGTVDATTGTIYATVTAAGSIGNISSAAGNSGIFSAGTSIGAISATLGNVSGSFTAGGAIGSVLLQNGQLSANLTAGGSIGAIGVISTGVAGIAGNTISGSSIGSIVVVTSGADAINGATFVATTGDLGSITAKTTGTGGNAIDGATFTSSAGGIGAIIATGNGTLAAITGATVNTNTAGKSFASLTIAGDAAAAGSQITSDLVVNTNDTLGAITASGGLNLTGSSLTSVLNLGALTITGSFTSSTISAAGTGITSTNTNVINSALNTSVGNTATVNIQSGAQAVKWTVNGGTLAAQGAGVTTMNSGLTIFSRLV